jgi:hemerythrin-like domain-containing protein
MLRDKNLVPLSRQHQHALALCVRINRAHLANSVELRAWQSEIAQHFDQEIRYHFDAEEKHLFPVAHNFPELEALIDELVAEHSKLRDYFARATAGQLDSGELRAFAETLSSHIRKEERQLFEGMQERMGPGALAGIGAKIDETLAAVSQACIVPTESKLKAEEESSP